MLDAFSRKRSSRARQSDEIQKRKGGQRTFAICKLVGSRTPLHDARSTGGSPRFGTLVSHHGHSTNVAGRLDCLTVRAQPAEGMANTQAEPPGNQPPEDARGIRCARAKRLPDCHWTCGPQERGLRFGWLRLRPGALGADFVPAARTVTPGPASRLLPATSGTRLGGSPMHWTEPTLPRVRGLDLRRSSAPPARAGSRHARRAGRIRHFGVSRAHRQACRADEIRDRRSQRTSAAGRNGRERPRGRKAFPGRILLPTSAGPGYLPVKPRIQRASAGVASGRPSSKAMRAMRATSSAFDAALRPGA